MHLLWSLPLAVAALYAAMLALLWFGQEKLIFLPQKLAADHRFEFGADVHEVWIERPAPLPSESPARLHALHLRLPAPEGIVFYLHGNAGNLQGWFVNADFWRGVNHDIFMLDYRGYGKSGGEVRSQEQLLADVRAAWDQVAPRYAGKRLVIVGRSLGSALAASLAADVAPDLTVLISPYESMAALAAEHYRWVPAALLRYPLRTDLAVARLKGRLLLLHGEQDEVIGLHHSERLLGQAKAVKEARLVRVPGAGHNDLQMFDTYLEALRATLAVAR
ncbi:MAG: alpha/beta fold hydrolase [Burkholderiales bacterium]|nr:alpha/beta fold hydrolase [Burkholderiales bacterium]